MKPMSVEDRPVKSELARYLGVVRAGEEQLAGALTLLAERHDGDPDVASMLKKFTRWSLTHAEGLERMVMRFGEEKSETARRLRDSLYDGAREGGAGLVQDLHDLTVQIDYVRMGYQILEQAAKEMRDEPFKTIAVEQGEAVERMSKWAKTKLKQAAPQAIVVPLDHTAG